MRWLKELFRPRLKCERLGHREEPQQRRTFRWPPESRWAGVADRCAEKRTVCGRCGAQLAPWAITERRPIDSLSMPQPDWDRLRTDGVLVR